jgi:RimJ/RimL family protein N-acetyltransferase
LSDDRVDPFFATMIETDRLILRELCEDDFDAVHAYASDPEVVEYVPWGPNTEQVTRDFIERHMEKAVAEPRLEYVFAVVPKGEDQLIGTVGIYLPSAEAHLAMLGYAYGCEAWGCGYATEAAVAMVAMGFDVLGVQRIWASCDPDNLGSARVLEKAGMRLEGRLRQDQNIRGALKDSLVWGILEPEWRDLDEQLQPKADSI